VGQLVDVDEDEHVLYLELALGSLDQQLEEHPDGFDVQAIKPKISTVLNILVRPSALARTVQMLSRL
jgi:hypothetical protein